METCYLLNSHFEALVVEGQFMMTKKRTYLFNGLQYTMSVGVQNLPLLSLGRFAANGIPFFLCCLLLL